MNAEVKGFDDQPIEKPPSVAVGGQSLAVWVGSRQNPAGCGQGFADKPKYRRL